MNGNRDTRVMTRERRTVHEKPVSSQHPDEHQHNREGEGQELGQSETPTAAKGNPAIRQIRDTLSKSHRPEVRKHEKGKERRAHP